MSDRFLKREDLTGLIESVRSGGGRFVAPTVEARQVVYKEVSSADEISADYIIPVNTYKEWVFPQTEVIADYRIGKNEVELRGREIDPPATVVFGARPCEAASLASLRSVFTWDFIDEFYTRREDRLVVLTVACTAADAECFCTTVGLSPASTDGSDVRLLETEDGDYIATALTDKGKAFVKEHADLFGAKPPKGAKAAELVTPEVIEGIDHEKIAEFLADTKNYGDSVWEEIGRKCFGCGACTFSCPTCHCFDITDEGGAFEGERRKNWDACQFDHFTLHASGHNPRDTQFKRYRNRFMCKFHIYPTKFKSTGCVGCGRCIRVCPTRVDITEAMAAITARRARGSQPTE